MVSFHHLRVTFDRKVKICKGILKDGECWPTL